MEQSRNTEECFWQPEPEWGYRLILYKQTPNYCHTIYLHVCSQLPSLKPSCECYKWTPFWSRRAIMSKGHHHTWDINFSNASPSGTPPGGCGFMFYLTWRKPSPHLSFLFQPDQYMDVFVTLAHDPGHFVLQPWLDMHKLTILMGDMFLYYTRKWKGSSTICVQKGEVYAAKVGKK